MSWRFSTGRFLLSLPLFCILYVWCLFWCLLSTFRCPAGCHIHLWGLNHWGLYCLAYVPQYQANSSPIVCAVLALDSWNYCLASLIKRKWNPRCHLVAGEYSITWQHLTSFIIDIVQLYKEDWVKLCSSCNCLVLKPHRQLGNFTIVMYRNVFNITEFWIGNRFLLM